MYILGLQLYYMVFRHCENENLSKTAPYRFELALFEPQWERGHMPTSLEVNTYVINLIFYKPNQHFCVTSK